MNSQARSMDLKAPLPSGQFRGFILFFHLVCLSMLGLTWYAHWHRIDGAPSRPDFVLTILVVLQALIYLFGFAIPSLVARWCLGRWWWFYFISSIVLALAICRIDLRFSWVVFPLVGQVSVLPLRTSIPVTLAILAAFILNVLPASQSNWLPLLFGVITWFVLAFFLGRLIVTSLERGALVLELDAAKRTLELSRQRDAELAVLRERERLARDLHDNLGHSLATLTVQLEAAQRLHLADPTRLPVLLGEMQKLTRLSMEDLRRSLSNLRAPGLGDRQITQALQTLSAESAKRSGVLIDCQVPSAADGLPPAVAEVLWRMAQEGLTNIEKHAQAHQVQIHLTLPPNEVVLRVSDDGEGLPAGAENRPGHYGLRGLRERIEGLGGSFIAQQTEKGTLLEARVPVIA